MSASRTREYAVFGFASTHDALAAEAALKEAGLSIAVIPAPAALGSLCGVAVKVDVRVSDTAEALLLSAGVPPTGLTTMDDY